VQCAPMRSCRRRRHPATSASSTSPQPPPPPPDYDYDRMPALFVSEDAFSLASYWDRRYYDQAEEQGQAKSEEWYRGGRCPATAAVLCAHLECSAPVLQIGVGTSRLQEEMVQPGFGGGEETREESSSGSGSATTATFFRSVLSTDFSPVAVRLQQQRHARLLASPDTGSWARRLTYAQADARKRLEGYMEDAFAGGVLDKGTLDALLCGDDADEAAAELLQEVWRLLAPGAEGGGAYVMVTSAAPDARRRLLPTMSMSEAAGVEEVEAEGGGVEGAGGPPPSPSPPRWSAVLVYRLGQEGALAGPAALGDAEAEAALLAAHEGDGRFAYSHYAYVCVK
jgi:EEF1A lysine methyltransferase 4